MIESQSAIQPYCLGIALDLHRHVNRLQCYRCQAGQRIFNALTRTALAGLRKKNKWLGSSGALMASQPLRQPVATLEAHHNTTLCEQHRFLGGIESDCAPTRKGVTEADKTNLLTLRKRCCKQDRPARPRGGNASKPCLSREQVCVLITWDRTGQTRDWVTRAATDKQSLIERCGAVCPRQRCAAGERQVIKPTAVTLRRRQTSLMAPSTSAQACASKGPAVLRTSKPIMGDSNNDSTAFTASPRTIWKTSMPTHRKPP